MNRFTKFKAIAKQVTPEDQADTSKGILTWSSEKINNDFPQYLIKLVDHSPTTQAVLQTFVKYLYGTGIINEASAMHKVNADHTLDQLLMEICKDFALMRGYALKVTFKTGGDDLVINSVSAIPFETTRLSIDDKRWVNGVMVNPFFGDKEFSANKSEFYPFFTTNKTKIISDIKKENYKGHILWRAENTPGHRFYPYTPLFSAKEWIGADGEIQKFHYNNIASGFMLKAVLNVYGDPNEAVETYEVEDSEGNKRTEVRKRAGEQLEELLQETVMGSDGTQVLINWINSNEQATKVETFNVNAYDSLYKEIQEQITEEIARVMQIPTQLANINTANTLNQSSDLLINAVNDMHSRVEMYHQIMVQDLKDIFSLNEKPLEIEINNYYPFPNDKHIDKWWEIASVEDKKEWIRNNTNFPISNNITL